MRPPRRPLPLISLFLTAALALNAAHADTMRKIEAPARADRNSAGTGSMATLSLPAGIPAPEPDPGSEPAENGSIPSSGPAVTKGMATGYAVCGIVILTGIILVKAVARSTEKAASKAVKDVFGPPQANGND